MREIVKPNGDTYMRVEVDDSHLLLTLNSGPARGAVIKLDKAIVSQLRAILSEAEFFGVI